MKRKTAAVIARACVSIVAVIALSLVLPFSSWLYAWGWRAPLLSNVIFWLTLFGLILAANRHLALLSNVDAK